MTTLKSNQPTEGGVVHLQHTVTAPYGTCPCTTPSSSGDQPLEEAPEDDLSPEELEQLLASVDPVDDVDPSKVTIPYEGKHRSVTGVIRLLRANGDDPQADVLEDMATLGKESKKFFRAAKRATATHRSPYSKQAK